MGTILKGFQGKPGPNGAKGATGISGLNGQKGSAGLINEFFNRFMYWVLHSVLWL